MVEAPAHVHDLLERSGVGATRPAVPTSLAWIGTAAVSLATVAALVVALPRMADATDSPVPVSVARVVTEGPGVRQLSVPGDDVPEQGVERLVVRHDSPDGDDADGTDGRGDGQDGATAPQEEPSAPAEPSPSPEPSEDEGVTPTPTPSPGDDGTPEDEPSPAPDDEPDGPLGDLLPGA